MTLEKIKPTVMIFNAVGTAVCAAWAVAYLSAGRYVLGGIWIFSTCVFGAALAISIRTYRRRLRAIAEIDAFLADPTTGEFLRRPDRKGEPT